MFARSHVRTCAAPLHPARRPQVNAQAAARILAEAAGLDTGDANSKKKRKVAALVAEGGEAPAPLPSLLEDDRFRAMFEDPEYTIDERSAEWRLLHPNTGERGGGRVGASMCV